MINTVEFGDVYICDFPSHPAKAARPAPPWCSRDWGADCLVCRITSVPHRGFLDLEVSDWRAAGLEKPSTIRLSRLVTIEKPILKVRIGQLGARPDDARRVRRRCGTKSSVCRMSGDLLIWDFISSAHWVTSIRTP